MCSHYCIVPCGANRTGFCNFYWTPSTRNSSKQRKTRAEQSERSETYLTDELSSSPKSNQWMAGTPHKSSPVQVGGPPQPRSTQSMFGTVPTWKSKRKKLLLAKRNRKLLMHYCSCCYCCWRWIFYQSRMSSQGLENNDEVGKTMMRSERRWRGWEDEDRV